MSNLTASIEDLTPAEANLGKVLALIHKVLPRLDDPGHKADVQHALTNAVALLENARLAHAGSTPLTPFSKSNGTHVGLTPQIVAVICAAVSVVLDQPYRLISVHPAAAPVVPNLNAWAVEGRTQIFMSHRVR